MSLNSIKLKLFNRIFQPWLYMLNPILRWKLQRQGAWGVVYMLHRVKEINPLGIEMNERMNVRPEYLEKVICKYRRQGFDFLSLDQLHNLIQNRKKPSRPFVVFTLDDGYIDNYTNAWPIFRRHQVPFAVYITTDFPDHKANMWWYVIEEYLNNNRADFNGYQTKEEAFRSIRQSILGAMGGRSIDLLKATIPNCEDVLKRYSKSEAMVWEQIREMSKDPLCTICGHTVSHPSFRSLNIEQIQIELMDGCKILSSHLDFTINHFAYPYGSPNEVGEKEMIVTENASLFNTITTSYTGFVNKETKTTRIPRMMLVDEIWNHRYFKI